MYVNVLLMWRVSKSADSDQTRRRRRGGWSESTLFAFVRRSLFAWRWSYRLIPSIIFMLQLVVLHGATGLPSISRFCQIYKLSHIFGRHCSTLAMGWSSSFHFTMSSFYIHCTCYHGCLSPLNKIINHSNTALWTIPNFEFGIFFTNFVVKFQTNYLYLQTVKTLIIKGLLSEPSDLGLNLFEN